MAVEVTTSRYIQKVFIWLRNYNWEDTVDGDIQRYRKHKDKEYFWQMEVMVPILDIEFDMQKAVWRLVWAGDINLGIVSIDIIVDALRHIQEPIIY